MEIDEKTKKIIGITVVGVGVVGVITAVGYYYFRKPKEEELGYDAKYEDLDNINDRMRRRNRFTVYSRENSFKDNSSFDGKVQKRFKVIEKEKSVIGRAGRLRTSGERYKHTPSGYNFNKNNRNATLNDLIIS